MTFETIFHNVSWLKLLFSQASFPAASTHHLTLPLAELPHPLPAQTLPALPYKLNLHSMKFLDHHVCNA